MDDKTTYVTSDLYLTAFLKTKGLKFNLIKVKTKFNFVFEWNFTFLFNFI